METLNKTATQTKSGDRVFTQPGEHGETLRDSVYNAMMRYFSQLDGVDPSDLYNLVQNEVEGPMLEALMHFTKSNQSRAARILGISRGTLRKKLKQYGML